MGSVVEDAVELPLQLDVDGVLTAGTMLVDDIIYLDRKKYRIDEYMSVGQRIWYFELCNR
jgi:hypothetical protein